MCTLASGNYYGRGGLRRADGLLHTGRHAKEGLALGVVVTDEGHVSAGGTGQQTAVASVGLHVAYHGTLGHHGKGQHVANSELGLLAEVHEHTGVHALGGTDELLVDLVLVGVAEVNLGKGSTTADIVNDLLYNTLDEAVPLGVVQATKLDGTLAVLGVRLKGKNISKMLLIRNTFLP